MQKKEQIEALAEAETRLYRVKECIRNAWEPDCFDEGVIEEVAQRANELEAAIGRAIKRLS